MPAIIGEPKWPQYVLQRYDFAIHNLAISQTAVALFLNVNDATSGALLNVGYTAINSGYVVGVSANLLAVKSAGVLGISPTIAAAEIASTAPLYRSPMASATPSIINAFTDYGVGALRFAKSVLLGIKVTTDGSFAPNGSADLFASLWVMYDPIQF